MAAKKIKRNTQDLTKLKEEYDSSVPAWNRMLLEIEKQLVYILENSGILPSFPIQKRVKTWSSIAEKLERVSLSLAGINDLQDIVGFRLVLQFQRDVSKIQEEITRVFKIVSQYNTLDRLKDDQFGYSSVHFVIELPDSWLAVPTMVGLGGLRAEIQVRTTAQYIWASASQTLQYKNEAGVPPQIRRAINRVSALLEFVDLEFERVLIERDNYKTDIVSDKEQDEILNVDLLEQILDELWPVQNKGVGKEDYSVILLELRKFGVSNRKLLFDILQKHYKEVMIEESRIVAERTKEKFYPDNGDKRRLDRGVFYLHTGLTRQALTKEFGEAYSNYLLDISKNEES